jgi:hypothetical protein
LLKAGFLDSDPLRVHDWQDHNGYHQAFSERAKSAARARWQKERTKGKEIDLPYRLTGGTLVILEPCRPNSQRNREASC